MRRVLLRMRSGLPSQYTATALSQALGLIHQFFPSQASTHQNPQVWPPSRARGLALRPLFLRPHAACLMPHAACLSTLSAPFSHVPGCSFRLSPPTQHSCFSTTMLSLTTKTYSLEHGKRSHQKMNNRHNKPVRTHDRAARMIVPVIVATAPRQLQAR